MSDAPHRPPSAFPSAAGFERVDLESWARASGIEGPFARLTQSLFGGLEVRPLYTADDAVAFARPGETHAPPQPIVRPRGPSGAAWDIRTIVAHPDPAEANRRILADLEGGATSVSLVLGGDGAGVGSLDRMLDGVHLEMVRVALDAGSAFGPAAAALAELWRRRGTPEDAAAADFQADPLGAAARSGRSARGLDADLADAGELASRTDAVLPRCRTICVDGSAWHEAGADAVQDLALALGAGVEYLRALERSGIDPERAARQIVFRLSVGSEFFLEIAKLRAARLLWERLLESCGVSAGARRMTLEVRTARRLMTRRDPWVNILRNTACCFVGAVAGADIVASVPFDETLGRPADSSRRLARNTQVLLHEECRLDAIVDPAAGSWAVEALTADFCRLAWEAFAAIESAGGFAAGLRAGSIQRSIAAAAAERASRVARRKRPLLGVSEYPNPDERLPERRPASTLASVADPAGDPVFGEAAEKLDPLRPIRLAEPFERLRDAADAHAARSGARPRVFLACLGELAEHNARSSFARNLLGAGGVEAIQPRGARDASAAVAAWKASGCRLALLCSSDAMYAELGVETARGLKAAGLERLWLAGPPGEREAAERAAGVDGYVHLGCDALEFLRDVATRLGVEP